MPPEGYKTVTIPEELYRTLDEAISVQLSRQQTIQRLIDERDGEGNADAVDYAEIERRCERAVESALESRR